MMAFKENSIGGSMLLESALPEIYQLPKLEKTKKKIGGSFGNKH